MTILPIRKSTQTHRYIHFRICTLWTAQTATKEVGKNSTTYFGGNAFVVRSHSLLSAASAVVRFDGSSVNISSSKLKAHGDNSLNQVNHNQMNHNHNESISRYQSTNNHQQVPREHGNEKVDRERERERELT